MALAQNSSFSPVSVPGFSVIPTQGEQLSEAVEQGPQKLAERQAATDTAKAQKAQADLAQQNVNDQLLQRIVAPALSNPAVAQSPQWQKLVSDKLASTGLQIPKGADGSIDLNALQGLVAPVVKPNADADVAAKLLQVPAGPARDALASLYNPASIDPQVRNGPMIPGPSQIAEFSKFFDSNISLAEQGKISPQAFISSMKTRQDMLPFIGSSWGAIDNNDLIVAGLGERTKADIQKLVDTGVLSRAKAAYALEDITKAKSVEQLNSARTKYLGLQGANLAVRDQIAVQNAATNAAKTQAYIEDVNQRIANATNGSWADRQRLLANDVQETGRQLRDATGDVVRLQGIISNARANGTDPTLAVGQEPSLVDSLTEAQARVAQLKTIRSQITSAGVNANAARGVLDGVGGAGTKNTPKNATDISTTPPSQYKSNPNNPNIYMDPQTKAVWDYSAKPRKYLGQAS